MSKTEDIKEQRAKALLETEGITFIRFKGGSLVKAPGTHGFAPIRGEWFSELCYKQFGMGVSKGSIGELQHAVESMAPDLTRNDRYIDFGGQLWDMKKLEFLENPLDVQYPVYSSSIAPNDTEADTQKVEQYLLSLADGDAELAKDYVQMVAPMFMYDKPVGIVWALGAGANGKSAFLDSLNGLLGKHFAHLTVDMIEDGRATPSLRGVLANVVSETSEKRVEDMQRYKNIGAHEPFDVRVLGTHDVVSIDTNFHTIFSANNIPAFGDKSLGSRRRTLLVPFPASFADDPGFVERTFTRQFLGAMLHLFLQATHDIKKNGYQWSEATKALQDRYNTDSNTAEAFARHLDEIGIVAFKNYNLLRLHYETWCSEVGSIALGRTHLTRAMENILHPVQLVYREADGRTVRRYFREGYRPEGVIWFDNGYGTVKPGHDDVGVRVNLELEGAKDW